MKRILSGVLGVLVLSGCGLGAREIALEGAHPALEDEALPVLEDQVTAARVFTLSSVARSSPLEALDLPAGLRLTVQLVTTRSGKNAGNRFARVKLENASSTDLPLPPLTTTLEARVPDARLSQSVSMSLKLLTAGKTAYRSSKAVNVSGRVYTRLCASATFAGLTTPVPLEVCEAGTNPPTAETVRATLEPLAGALVPSPTPEQSAWTWVQPTEPPAALETLTLEQWAASQPQRPALSAFVSALRRQFSSVTVYVDELPCHNCHQFVTTVLGTAPWGLGGFTMSVFWDS